jgi:uracil-DNA glycosylase
VGRATGRSAPSSGTRPAAGPASRRATRSSRRRSGPRTPGSARTSSASGRAGRTLRRWLELDEDAFYGTFYCASVTRCYPGRAPSGRGDRTPTPREQELCEFWRDRELELLLPRLIVTVGGLALRRLLGLPRLTTCIGERYERDGAVVVPLPHPSGASGWLNVPANRERLAAALGLVRDELEQLRPAAAEPPPS